MKCYICAVRYIPADNYTYIDQGYKRGEYPEGYVLGGGNGTYRMWGGSRADIEILLQTNERKLIKVLIGDDVRRIMKRTRLTEHLAERIIAAQPIDIEIDSNKKVLEQDLQSWFSKV